MYAMKEKGITLYEVVVQENRKLKEEIKVLKEEYDEMYEFSYFKKMKELEEENKELKIIIANEAVIKEKLIIEKEEMKKIIEEYEEEDEEEDEEDDDDHYAVCEECDKKLYDDGKYSSITSCTYCDDCYEILDDDKKDDEDEEIDTIIDWNNDDDEDDDTDYYDVNEKE